jgi:calcineurin-like phosphoesterase family protein
MIYFTSDTHFFHGNIIGYCNRPFADIDTMNEGLIEKWNRRVTPEDTVYHLGDVSFGKLEATQAIIQRLNGYKILVKGNHDRSHERMIEMGFQESISNLYLQTEKGMAYLAHEPKPNGIWGDTVEFQLCGHVHDLWKVKEKWYNVGVDVWGYEPKTIEELFN